MAVGQCVASAHPLSIVGGGDSNAAVKKSGEEKNISYMSTGGGAFLEPMEGKTLPGVAGPWAHELVIIWRDRWEKEKH